MKSLRKLGLPVLMCVVLLAALSGTASAKMVAFAERSEDAEWGDLSNAKQAPAALPNYAMYGKLDVYGDVDAFAYQFDGPEALWPVQVVVPVCGEHFAAFAPLVAVIGPGLETPLEGTLPFELPEGTGALILAEQSPMSREDNFFFNGEVQLNLYQMVAIPEAGQYYVAVWEPDGNVGAYVVSTGNTHAEPMTDAEAARMEAAFRLINSGEWMGQDCDAPLATAECPATEAHFTGANDAPPAPERMKVGEGYVLTGRIMDAENCMPIAHARLVLWVRDEQGEYTDEQFAMIYTNAQGAYRFETNYPGGPDPHIHVHISADGYRAIVLEHLLEPDATAADMPITLLPR